MLTQAQHEEVKQTAQALNTEVNAQSPNWGKVLQTSVTVLQSLLTALANSGVLNQGNGNNMASQQPGSQQPTGDSEKIAQAQREAAHPHTAQ
jgi:hypothetical protein